MYLRTKRNKKRYQKKSNNIIKGNVEDSKNTIKNKSQSYKNKKKNIQISNLTKTYYIKN